jgi:MFS family permease
MTDIGANQTPDVPRNTLRRIDGELILLWTLPATLIIWIAGFFLFPGFNPPMSPTMTAEQVAAFYRDPAHLPEIRYSMIVFNWFGVCLVPILALIVLQIRRMAHRTPIFSYAMLGCVAGGPTLFLIANVCWLLAAFRTERSPELTQLLNDFAWMTFTILVPFLIGQSVILALAIYFDDQPRPVFKRWVAHFNLLVAAVLVPAAFVGVTLTGPLAWNGFLSFWVKNVAIAVWIVVMGVALGRAVYQERAENGRRGAELVDA